MLSAWLCLYIARTDVTRRVDIPTRKRFPHRPTIMSTAEYKPCPVCGEEIRLAARRCRHCGEVFEKLPEVWDEGDATGGVIPYKNPKALLAYYLGLFSLFPCFILGWVALYLGLQGLAAAKKNPRIKGTVHAWIGILVGGFFGLIWTLATVLALVGSMVR